MGAVVDLGSVVAEPSPPETEDHMFNAAAPAAPAASTVFAAFRLCSREFADPRKSGRQDLNCDRPAEPGAR